MEGLKQAIQTIGQQIGGTVPMQTHEINVGSEYNYSDSYGFEIHVEAYFMSESYASISQNINLTGVSYLTFKHKVTELQDAGTGNGTGVNRLEFYVVII